MPQKHLDPLLPPPAPALHDEAEGQKKFGGVSKRPGQQAGLLLRRARSGRREGSPI
jgi:hypothetical protein